MHIYVNYCSADSPVSFKEAIESDESNFWVDAMNKEMNSLQKNKTWVLVEKPKNEKVLDLKWIYTKKTENVYKARIVVTNKKMCWMIFIHLLRKHKL